MGKATFIINIEVLQCFNNSAAVPVNINSVFLPSSLDFIRGSILLSLHLQLCLKLRGGSYYIRASLSRGSFSWEESSLPLAFLLLPNLSYLD